MTHGIQSSGSVRHEGDSHYKSFRLLLSRTFCGHSGAPATRYPSFSPSARRPRDIPHNAADRASARVAMAPGNRIHDVSPEPPCARIHKPLPRRRTPSVPGALAIWAFRVLADSGDGG